MHRIFAGGALLVLLAACGSVAGAQYTAVDLYSLQAPAGWNKASTACCHQTAFAGQVVGATWEPSDPGANPTPHPVLWKADGSAEDLNPNGFDAREMAGTDGIHQFGYAITGGIYTPVVWSGSAASATFLNKQGFASAQLAGSGGGQFVGSGKVQATDSEHALLWNSLTAQPIDLYPSSLESRAYGASGNQQVGSIFGGEERYAWLWTGSANSGVNLNPFPNLPGIFESEALATDGLQQVGYGYGPDAAGTTFPSLSHALLWNGSAGSAADLNPHAFDYSIAYGVRNGKQVGAGITENGYQHALVWSGSSASAIDLHLLLPNAFDGSIASAIDDAGHVFGFAYNIADGQEHAIEWLPVAELSGDYNHDGKVDAADYVVWRKSNGSQSGYNTWRSHFGPSAGSGAALPSVEPLSAAVPEPATIVLFGVGLAATFGALSQRSKSRRARHRANHRQAVRRPRVEPLEDRCLLSFSSTWPYPLEDPDTHIAWAPPPPLVADFTSDGILDKISSNYHEVIVRPGRGDGTFGDPIRSAIHPSWGAPALAVADFSNDGRLDVFTFDWDYHDNYCIANVVLGSGNGRFSLWETLEFGTDYSGVLGTGDINRDGLRDVAIAAGHDPDTGEPYLTALFNDGNWPSVVPALPGDYNRNGTVDAADYIVWRKTLGTSRPNYSGADGNGNGVVDQDDHAVWHAHFGQALPAGAGSLVTAVPEPATVVLFGVALAAMFGSLSQRSNSRRTGRRTNHRHAVRRPSFEPLEDRCLLSFSPAISYPVGSSPQVMAAGDFNNDGHLDLATVNYDANADVSTVSVLLGDGRGGFGAAIGPASNPLGGAKPVSLAVADFNNDGYRDLAVVASYRNPETMETYGSLNLLLGNGNGIFQPPARPGYAAPLAVAAGDFNNDGKSDFVVSEYDLEWGNAQVYAQLGNGHGGFTPPGAQGWSLLPYPLGAATVADLNRDGNLDVVLWAPGGSTGYALLGNGHGSFSYDFSKSEFLTGSDVRGLAVGEFTGDGIPDLISAGETVDMLRGHGDGLFDAPISQIANSAIHTGVAVADFNGDGKLDATTSDADTGTVSLMMGNGNGSLTYVGAYAVGSSPSAIVVADFNGDGRPDVAAANAGSNTVSVLLNDGNWPATSPALPGNYNGNGVVDAADYVVWRKTLGSSVPNYTGADGNGNGVVDQDDQAVWRAHFGQTLPAVGAGSLVAAANAITPELSASVESVEVTERASASVEPAEPDERGSIEPQGTNARDSALAVLDSRLPQFVPQGKATMRRLHALSTTDSGMKARGNDLLLVRSSAAKFDQQPSESGRNSRLIDDSSEEAVENHREALDIAFTTLKHAKWQIGGNMLRRVWAGLWFAFVFFIGAHGNAVPVVIYSNFGPWDSVKNSDHDVLNQQSYGEHAARFFVPTGTDFTFTGIEVPISDTLAANEGIESQLSIRLWTDNVGQPGTLLESMTTDVNNFFAGYLIQHVDSTSNTTLLRNNYYWISLAAINPGRVGWFVNNTETGGYAFKSPNGAPWLVIDTANAGAFRVFGEAALVPEPTTLYLGTMAVIGMRWRRRRRRVSPVRI